MADKGYVVRLSRWQVGQVLSGLRAVIARRRSSLRRVQKEAASSGVHRAGDAAGRAIEIADLEELHNNIVAGVEQEDSDRLRRDADICERLQAEEGEPCAG